MTATDGRQLKAARAILGLTVDAAAELAAINRKSVLRAEGYATLPRRAWGAEQIVRAFERRGVVFETGQDGLAVWFAPEAL